MKNLILLLIAILTFSVANAQSFAENETYKVVNGQSDDTLKVSTDSSKVQLFKTFYLGKKEFEYNYFIEADVDSAGDGSYVDCLLRGSNNGAKYYPIDTVRWALSSSDTTITFNSFTGTSGTHWRYVQLYFTSDSLGANLIIPQTGGPLRARILKE